MPLSAEQLDKLSLYSSIIQDRGWGIELTLRKGTVDDDECDELAQASFDIAEAAAAIELVCLRVARGARLQRAGDVAGAVRDPTPPIEEKTNTLVNPSPESRQD